MDKIQSSKFWQEVNRSKTVGRRVILALLAIALVFGAVGFYQSKRDLGTPQNLADVRTQGGKYAYIDVVAVADTYLQRGNTERYYLVKDAGGNLCVVDMFQDSLDRVALATVDNPVRLVGKTKALKDQEVIGQVIMIFNSSNIKDPDMLTTATFKQRVGTVFLWAREDPQLLRGQAAFYAVGGIFLAFALATLIAYAVIVARSNRIINKLSPDEARLISSELDDPATVCFEKTGVFLTPHYVISVASAMKVIAIADIAWVYFIEIRQTGVRSNITVVIVTHDGKNWSIPTVPFGKTRNAHLEIIDGIAARNPGVLVGYTDENRRLMGK